MINEDIGSFEGVLFFCEEKNVLILVIFLSNFTSIFYRDKLSQVLFL